MATEVYMDDGPVYDDGFTKVYLELEYSIKRRITQARYEQLRPKFNQQMNKIVSGVSDKRFLKDPRQPKFSDYLTKQLPFNLNSAKNTAIMRRLETNRGMTTMSRIEWKQPIVQQNKTLWLNAEVIPVTCTESLERALTLDEMCNFAYRTSRAISSRAMHYKRSGETTRHFIELKFDEFAGLHSIPENMHRFAHVREAIEMYRSDDNNHSYYYTLEQELCLNSDQFTGHKDLIAWWYLNGMTTLNHIILSDRVSLRQCLPIPMNIDERWIHTLYHNFNYRPITIYSHDEATGAAIVSQKTFLSIKLDGTKYLGLYYNNQLLYISNDRIKSKTMQLHLDGCYVVNVEEFGTDNSIKIIDILGVISAMQEQYTFLTKEDLFCGGTYNVSTSGTDDIPDQDDAAISSVPRDIGGVGVVGGGGGGGGGNGDGDDDDATASEEVVLDDESAMGADMAENRDDSPYVPTSPDYQDLFRFDFEHEAGDFGSGVSLETRSTLNDIYSLSQYIGRQTTQTIQPTIWLNPYFMYTPIDHMVAIEYMNKISQRLLDAKTPIAVATDRGTLKLGICKLDRILRQTNDSPPLNQFLEVDISAIPLSEAIDCLAHVRVTTKNDGFLLFREPKIFKIKQEQTIELAFNTIKLLNHTNMLEYMQKQVPKTKRKVSAAKKKNTAVIYGENDSFMTERNIKHIALDLDNGVLEYLECCDGSASELFASLGYSGGVSIDWSAACIDTAHENLAYVWQNWTKNGDCPFIRLYPMLEFRVRHVLAGSGDGDDDAADNDSGGNGTGTLLLEFVTLRRDKYIADSINKTTTICSLKK